VFYHAFIIQNTTQRIMPIEIEHKFIVNKDEWSGIKPENSLAIKQAYLSTDPDKTIRLRTLGKSAFITIKGKTANAVRKEFEYEIPLDEAVEMIELFGENVIEKTRHYIHHLDHLWEVDEFFGLNAGLLVAEVELTKEDETYAIPGWAGQDVTEDARYYNSYLIKHPYSTWNE
jgi:adenylate cyclase